MATSKKTIKSPAKKASNKATPVKTGVKQGKKGIISAKKSLSKPIPKSKNPKPDSKKPSAPIKNSASVKKTAKPMSKNAAPKKLNPIKKMVAPAKKESVSVKGKSPVVKTLGKHGSKTEPNQHNHAVQKTENKQVELKSLPKAKDIKVPKPKPVILPKITSTKSRKYEPEFTKSVLDQPAFETKGPSQRYSDQELNEFRELIQRKLETAKKELGYLQGLITRKDEMGGDDNDNRYMTMEDGSLSMEREQLSQMASRQITFIDHLEKAMMRIENKTYGICRVTGKLIDKARLRAVPHATLSIEAKMGIVK